MSIYSDLLTTAVGADELRWRASPGELLATVLEWRARLQAADERSPGGFHRDVSLALNHDVALLHLGRAMGIEVGPEQFAQPHVGRERLVRQLASCGPRPRGAELAGEEREA